MDDEIPMPALLRESRGAYAHAVRSALDDLGLGGLPANSAFLLGGLANFDVPLDTLVGQRRRSIDRNRTVEALIAAGCLEKSGASIVLTDQGRKAAKACQAATASLTAHLVESVGTEAVAAMRKGLIALIEWKEAHQLH